MAKRNIDTLKVSLVRGVVKHCSVEKENEQITTETKNSHKLPANEYSNRAQSKGTHKSTSTHDTVQYLNVESADQRESNLEFKNINVRFYPGQIVEQYTAEIGTQKVIYKIANVTTGDLWVRDKYEDPFISTNGCLYLILALIGIPIGICTNSWIIGIVFFILVIFIYRKKYVAERDVVTAKIESEELKVKP